MRNLIIIWLVIFNNICLAQAPTIQWQHSYGGTDEDRAYSIKQTPDGGYIVLGSASSNDSDVSGNHILGPNTDDFWLIKIDSVGTLQWQRCYGGTSDDEGKYVSCTSDGGYILIGTAFSQDGDVTGLHVSWAPMDDYWVIKTDNTGAIQWQKCFGGTDVETGFEIHQTIDGGYVAIGESSSDDGDVTGHHSCNGCDRDLWVVKMDGLGNLQWEKSLGGTSWESEPSIIQLNTGEYIILAGTQSSNGDVVGFHGASDAWLVKLSISGNLVWQKCLGGSNYEGWGDALQTTDGGYILNLGTISTDGDVTCVNPQDMWLVKTDNLGSIQWQGCSGGSGTDNLSKSMLITSDGGTLIGGYTNSNDGPFTSFHGYLDYAIEKFDSIGNFEWSKCLGGTLADWGQSLALTNDGGFVVAGYSNSNDGDVSGNHGGVGCPGVGQCSDFWIVKLSPEPLNVSSAVSTNYSLIYNRSNNNIECIINLNEKRAIQFQLIDLTGRVLLHSNQLLHSGENKVDISAGQLIKGIFFMRFLSEESSVTKKLIIE